MKNLYVILLGLVTIISVNLVASDSFCECENMDAFTGASKKNYYSKTSITGDALQKVINSHEAAFVLSTTNPDNSPHAAVFIPAMASDSEVKFGLAENQTRQNIERTKKAVLTVYRFLPDETKKKRHQGARLILELDENKSDQKNTHKMIIMKIQHVLPLG